MESFTIIRPPSSLSIAGSALQTDPPEAYSSPEQVACHCYGASEPEIIKIVVTEGLSSLSELTELTGFGGACRACGKCLQRIVDEQQPAVDKPLYSEPLHGNARSKPPSYGYHSLT